MCRSSGGRWKIIRLREAGTSPSEIARRLGSAGPACIGCWVRSGGRSAGRPLTENRGANCRVYSDQQAVTARADASAMVQMACVFGTQERSMLRTRGLALLQRVRQQRAESGCNRHNRWRVLRSRWRQIIRAHCGARNSLTHVPVKVEPTKNKSVESCKGRQLRFPAFQVISRTVPHRGG